MGMKTPYTERFNPRPCDCCLKVEVEGQWWHLNNYYGISGYFCPLCNDKVSHNALRQPNNPEAYHQVYIQQTLEKSS